jgi:hypothetical protein
MHRSSNKGKRRRVFAVARIQILSETCDPDYHGLIFQSSVKEKMGIKDYTKKYEVLKDILQWKDS